MAFSPANITVKTGAKVTWTNDDSVAHTVVENDSQTGPKSGDIMPGKSYSFTFTKAGTYHYHCTIHPNMIGTVTVTK
jgi:plastocyanin